MTTRPCLPNKLFLFILLILNAGALRASCMDSIGMHIQPVQCYGLRNGEIHIDTVFGGTAPFYYSLDGQSFSTRPVFELLWAGSYTLWVRDAMGCLLKTTLSVPEPEQLKVNIIASDTMVEAGVLIKLKAEVTPAQTVLKEVRWRPPQLFEMDNSLEKQTRISETTEFYVEIKDIKDCPAFDFQTVEVIKTNVYFPNAIQPGSNENAYFTGYAGEGVAKIEQLQIYSRSGALVFEAHNIPPNDPGKGWNGRWEGKKAPNGVYPYIAIVEYLDGKRKRFIGTLTVVE